MKATTPALPERVDALERAATLARDRLADRDVERALTVATKARERLGHGTSHTLVALAGPTGAGKSTIFNRLAGSELSAPGIRRPTTSEVHACTWGDPPHGLLDWLGVASRHHRHVDDDPSLAGLVLLDLPDFDSTAHEHKITVDRLVELVDLLVWVTDPQKYADASLHDGYLVPLAGHCPVMRFVLNKIDTVAESDRAEVVADFERRIALDGIEGGHVIPTSDTEGGLAGLRTELEVAVGEKHASLRRLDADLTAAARPLETPTARAGITRRGRARLVDDLATAAGGEHAGRLAGAQHRADGRRALASPPARWFARRSRKPAASLPRLAQSPVHSVAIAAALRDGAEEAAGDVTGPWRAALRATLQQQEPVVTRRLTDAMSSAVRRSDRPHWWSAVAWLQRLLALSAATGFVWLLAVAFLGGFLGFDTDPLLIDTPGADWIPVPSLLALGGVGGSLLVTFLSRLPLGVGARRRSRRARAEIEATVGDIVDADVISAIDAVLADRDEIARLVDIAAAPR